MNFIEQQFEIQNDFKNEFDKNFNDINQLVGFKDKILKKIFQLNQIIENYERKEKLLELIFFKKQRNLYIEEYNEIQCKINDIAEIIFIMYSFT